MMQHKRSAHNGEAFPFEHRVFENWLQDSVVSLHVNEDEKYVPHFASLTEYLVNPSIRKKNYLVLKELTDHFLPYLEQNP
jgi:hypothetical protein